jgi:apolipoprotein D and lipocalin family protein
MHSKSYRQLSWQGKAKSMKTLCLFAVLVLVFACTVFRGPDFGDQTVARVDLERYMGKWVEIASFPAWFQRDCFCTMAEYELRGDHVSVKNSCRKGSSEGELDIAMAKAFAVAGSNNSRLKVQFFWPFKGDYWIIALDDNYQYAMVGHPNREYLWILSRTPEMSEDVYQSLVETARGKGYDITKLRKTLCTDGPK